MDRFPDLHQVLWTTCPVADRRLVDVDTQVVIQGCEDLLQVPGTNHRPLGIFVRSTDDLPGFHATAGQQAHGDAVPVIALTVVIIDPQRATKLTRNHHAHVLVQSAFTEFLEECTDDPVKLNSLPVIVEFEPVRGIKIETLPDVLDYGFLDESTTQTATARSLVPCTRSPARG